jgi:hypothetical protein
MTDQIWMLASVIEFSDGGEPEMQIIHCGTKKSCEQLADSMPAIAYSGSRPITRASLRWAPGKEGS